MPASFVLIAALSLLSLLSPRGGSSESVRAVPSTIGERERANRDDERFERCRRTLACRFAGQDARNVGFKRQRSDRVSATIPHDTDLELQSGRRSGLRPRKLRCRNQRDRREEREVFQGHNSR